MEVEWEGEERGGRLEGLGEVGGEWGSEGGGEEGEGVVGAGGVSPELVGEERVEAGDRRQGDGGGGDEEEDKDKVEDRRLAAAAGMVELRLHERRGKLGLGWAQIDILHSI